MARYRGATCKLARAVGTDPGGLKRRGRDVASKCKMAKRPGQFGDRKPRGSNYALQLRAKQLIRIMYGVLEAQFRKYYQEATRQKGPTGQNLLKLLESRLDNVVYRMGFGSTRAEARQLVRHKSIQVKAAGGDAFCTVNIPSYQVKPGDEIAVRERSKEQTRIQDSIRIAENAGFPEWVSVDTTKLSGTFKNVPDRDQLPAEINEQLVVELYSK